MNSQNEVLYHTIAYFLENTDRCYLTKLLKLIYLFDLEHLRTVGVSATGKKYHAWNLGPVTEELYYSIHDESENVFPDFKESFDVDITVVEGNESYLLKPKFELDLDVFSKLQLDLLSRLSEQYKSFRSKDLVNITHKKNDPWHIVYEIDGKAGQEIPMTLAFDILEQNKKNMLLSRYKEINGED